MKNKDFYKIAEELLPTLRGFESNRGRLVFYSPIRHTLKGFCLDTSDAKRDFYLHWFFQPLCDGTDNLALDYGARVTSPRGTQVWSADIPNLGDAILRSIQEPLTFLQNLNSEHDVVNAIKRCTRGNPTFYKHIHCAYLLILSGDFKAADKDLVELFSRESEASRNWERQLFDTAHSVHKLLRENSIRALQQILSWREETLRSLHLQEWAARIPDG